jgi:hypothetical protein
MRLPSGRVVHETHQGVPPWLNVNRKEGALPGLGSTANHLFVVGGNVWEVFGLVEGLLGPFEVGPQVPFDRSVPC